MSAQFLALSTRPDQQQEAANLAYRSEETHMIRRRGLLNVIGAAALGGVWPAMAQVTGRSWRVGIMPGGPMAPRQFQWDVFFGRMRELGYAEGRNVQFVVRAPAKEGGPFDDLAADLVRAKVDVIVATSNAVVAAARRATQQIPIVMCPGSDPVALGFVASLGRPGTNITGVNLQFEETAGKRLQLLREMLPKVARVAFLFHDAPGVKAELETTQQAASTLGFRVQVVTANSPDAIPGAFDEAVKGRAEAVVVSTSAFAFGMRTVIATLASRHRLPSIFSLAVGPDSGQLMSYGPNDREYYRQAAGFADRILKGTKPGDLPVEQPIKWELVINLNTAKSLGITVPQGLLLQAERVVE
ncbi:MAG: ABC transporter substrate-binding protein [Burkholderiales bacterium]|nr:ABC transporter substrate-binding protein [Burkholderiales bacterium]